MYLTTKIATKMGASAAIAAVALIATATAANAATVSPNGTGFVGKGEVQSAFNMSNGKIQPIIDKDVNAFTFRAVQPTTQLLTQDVSQMVRRLARRPALSTPPRPPPSSPP